MRIGKAILASAAAASLVATPAMAGAEKLAVSAAAQTPYSDPSDTPTNTNDENTGGGMDGTLIALGAGIAAIAGITTLLSSDIDQPTSP